MNVGVHRTHCCDKHGCKYGEDKCPVVLGSVKQDYPCETCGTCDRRDGGFYEQVGKQLVWHPRIHELLARIARQLGAKGQGKLTPRCCAISGLP